MASLIFLMFFLLSINANGLRKKERLGLIHWLQSLPSACVSDVECLAWFQGPNPVVWLSYFVRAFLLLSLGLILLVALLWLNSIVLILSFVSVLYTPLILTLKGMSLWFKSLN